MNSHNRRRAPDRGSPGRSIGQITLQEIVLWISGIAVAFATPHWIGSTSLIVFFYGTLGFLTWRLSRLMSMGFAVALAFVAAVLFTVIMIPIVQQ